MICKKCGSENLEGKKFCGECGENLTISEGQSQVNPTPEQTSETNSASDVQSQTQTGIKKKKSITFKILLSVACLIIILIAGIFSYGIIRYKTLNVIEVMKGNYSDDKEPKEKPSDFCSKYLQYFRDTNYSDAYDLLASYCKEQYTKDDFVLAKNIQKELLKQGEFKIESEQKLSSNSIDGNTYLSVYEIKYTSNNFSYIDNKDTTSNEKLNVVNENGEWKIYREKEDMKLRIASNYARLANMNVFPEEGNPNYNKALEYISEALKYDKDNTYTYYTQATAYFGLGRYDEGISIALDLEKRSEDNEDKSLANNVLGMCYWGKNMYSEAKSAFEKSIQLDPNNEYAKSNLAKLTK